MTTLSAKTMPDLCNHRHPLHYATALNLLIKLGVDLSRVHILPIGKYKNYKGEVFKQTPAAGSRINPDTKFELHIGFSAAIDQLPYQFFYGLHNRFSRGTGWEDQSRRLLAAFDAPLVRYQARAVNQTLKFNFALPDKNQLKRFLGLFDFDTDQDGGSDDTFTWAMLLPAFHRWAGNPDGVAEILELLFGFSFRIEENIPAEFEIPKKIRYHLGAKTGRLGRETILGSSFIECDSTYRVIISGLDADEVNLFRPGQPRRRKLDWVLGNCMPGCFEYSVSFEMKTGPKLQIGKNTRLGFTSYMK